MRCTRIYVDENGESHFSELDIPLMPAHPGGAGPTHASAPLSSTHVQFLAFPPKTVSDWQTSPARQLVIVLDGAAEFETSDGDRRRIVSPGILLVEDTWGKGHRTRLSDQPQMAMIILLSNGAPR
jgi:quercetin dioxygenase-like cupin family protein